MRNNNGLEVRHFEPGFTARNQYSENLGSTAAYDTVLTNIEGVNFVVLRYALSVCHPSDVFQRNVGSKMAADRFDRVFGSSAVQGLKEVSPSDQAYSGLFILGRGYDYDKQDALNFGVPYVTTDTGIFVVADPNRTNHSGVQNGSFDVYAELVLYLTSVYSIDG